MGGLCFEEDEQQDDVVVVGAEVQLEEEDEQVPQLSFSFFQFCITTCHRCSWVVQCSLYGCIYCRVVQVIFKCSVVQLFSLCGLPLPPCPCFFTCALADSTIAHVRCHIVNFLAFPHVWSFQFFMLPTVCFIPTLQL